MLYYENKARERAAAMGYMYPTGSKHHNPIEKKKVIKQNKCGQWAQLSATEGKMQY